MKKNMIYRIKSVIAIIGITLMLNGCDDFLNTEPDNRLQLDDIEQVQALLVNAYPEGSWLFTEWMTDNVGLTPNDIFLPHMVEIYSFEDVTEKMQDTPTYYWTSAYRAIAHANQALDALDQLASADPDHEKALRAEALICRSYAHFMLVNLFAKPYDPQTASSDLGIPYVKDIERELIVQYTRNSIAEVYELAEKDLLEGIELKQQSSEKYYSAIKYHFNMNAVWGYASRFYLFKKDYQKCIEYSNKLLGAGYYPSFIKDFSKVNVGHPTRNAQRFTAYDDASNLMLARIEVFAHPFYQIGYRLSFDIFNQIFFQDQSDVRGVQSFIGNQARTVVYLPKHHWAVKDNAFPYMIVTQFRGEEVFLNRLEALLLSGKTAEMEQQLAQFVANRYRATGETLAYEDFYREYTGTLYPNHTKNETLLKIILDERRREFVDEGLRWLDIRRHMLIPIQHEDINGVVHTLTEDKLTMQIPADAISKGLEPNPSKQPMNNIP